MTTTTTATTTEEASYIDYETFIAPDFDPQAFANTLVLSTNDPSDTPLDLSTPLSRVLFDVQEIDTHIDSLTTSSALPLLQHTSTRAAASTHLLENVEAQVKGLQEAYARLKRDVQERYADAEEVRLVAERSAATLRLARAVARCLQLGRGLENNMVEAEKKISGYRALVPATTTALALRGVMAGGEGDDAATLNRVDAVTTLRTELLDPAERTLLQRAQQSVREFSMSSLTGAAAAAPSMFAHAEDTRARTLSALQTLYLLSPIKPSSSSVTTTKQQFNPTILVSALQQYLQTALTASSTSLARALATLPTLDRTLLDISARCQNIVALESLLDATKPPPHPSLLLQPPRSADLDPPPTFLTPLLQALDTSSLPSYFWRSLAGALGPRVQDIVARGGVSARTLKSNRERVRDAVRECVHRGSQLPASGLGSRTSNRLQSVGNWEREAAVMVGSINGALGR